LLVPLAAVAQEDVAMCLTMAYGVTVKNRCRTRFGRRLLIYMSHKLDRLCGVGGRPATRVESSRRALLRLDCWGLGHLLNSHGWLWRGGSVVVGALAIVLIF
jgi:hypothetical protein